MDGSLGTMSIRANNHVQMDGAATKSVGNMHLQYLPILGGSREDPVEWRRREQEAVDAGLASYNRPAQIRMDRTGEPAPHGLTYGPSIKLNLNLHSGEEMDSSRLREASKSSDPVTRSGARNMLMAGVMGGEEEHEPTHLHIKDFPHLARQQSQALPHPEEWFEGMRAKVLMGQGDSDNQWHIHWFGHDTDADEKAIRTDWWRGTSEEVVPCSSGGCRARQEERIEATARTHGLTPEERAPFLEHDLPLPRYSREYAPPVPIYRNPPDAGPEHFQDIL